MASTEMFLASLARRKVDRRKRRFATDHVIALTRRHQGVFISSQCQTVQWTLYSLIYCSIYIASARSHPALRMKLLLNAEYGRDLEGSELPSSPKQSRLLYRLLLQFDSEATSSARIKSRQDGSLLCFSGPIPSPIHPPPLHFRLDPPPSRKTSSSAESQTL